ncbi:ClpXP protease specificity-enhancing factor [Methylocucumis oryzae]|uniref:Peptidase n=1 Tax=Methylocucumis oryzae TaxID=1632867 RepID=A0A0F3IG70_9GAMM|nr:ClpXP protease specificity-enhancing factor [Methylocucumis oryzae]KJV05795.1 peptidase [Methylocucumis oryzae]
MTSLKPYLIRAIYDWIVDNDLTPYLIVDAMHPEARVPEQYIQDGKIVLNIRPQAVEALILGDDTIEFNARFSGQPMHILVPVSSVLEISAKENGKGMSFAPEPHDFDEPPPPVKPAKKPSPSSNRPNLRIVK